MKSCYVVPLIGICVLFGGCGNPTASSPDPAITEPSQAPPDTSTSAAQQTTNKIKSALDKAQSATEKASKSVHTALEQASKATESASKAIEDIIIIKTQLKEMSIDAGDTLKSVQSGDFQTAQQEFAQLQQNWNTIREPVKESSPQVYQEVNTQLATIDSLLKQSYPNHTELAKQLSSFSDSNLALLNIYSQGQREK